MTVSNRDALLRILIVDDDAEDVEITRDLLADTSLTAEVTWKCDVASGMQAAEESLYDVCLIDHQLPDGSGPDLIRRARNRGVHTPMILLTGHANRAVDVEAQEAGADDFLSKNRLTAELLERSLRFAMERAKSVAALRESEDRYRLLFDANPVPTWVMDRETTRIVAVNSAALRQYGYDREEFLGLSALELRPPEERQRFVAMHEATMNAGDTQPFGEGIRWRHVRKDGTQLDVEVSYQTLTFGGRPAVIVLARDITRQSEAEAALFESEQRFRELVEHVPAVFFVGDVKTKRALYLSPKYESIMDQSRMDALRNPRAWLACVHPDDRPRVEDHLCEEMPGTVEFRIVRRDGEVRWIRRRATVVPGLDGQPARIVGTGEDITQLRAAQMRADMTSRMEATGRLAGGVAHDFNNLLTIIVSYAEMMLADRDEEAPDRGDLNQILEAGRSAANLTKQLLAFSRQQVIAPQHVDLESSVDRAESLLRRVIGEDIELVRVGGDIPTTVIIDPGQFEQVIINLAVNARDAMPRGGKLTIETRVDDVDEEFAQAHWPMKPGRFAVLAVADTGVGMDEATRRRVFEPFFTTKAPGQGTGLGLATVYGIVKQANGFVWVYSEPGIGTQFRIYLPLAEEQTESVTEPMDPCPLQGTERILLVEDSPSVRSVARRNLERFGYRVIEAPTAEAAIALAEAGVDLLLTDVVMPGLSGREVAEQIVERFPAVKVMFMSGYTDDAIVRHGVLSNEVGYLQKPFTGEALVRKVRAVLDGDTAHVSR